MGRVQTGDGNTNWQIKDEGKNQLLDHIVLVVISVVIAKVFSPTGELFKMQF